jgi:hypothetical protein
MTCAICGDPLDTEHPESIYQHNPLTFREAWMHRRCIENAFEEISMQPASSPEYEDRLDEYNVRFD